MALLLALWPISGSANGSSITLYLSYLPGLSSVGPEGATGQAKLNVGEGQVDLVAEGLAKLSREVYEVWLVTADRQTWVSLGRFQAGDDGRAHHFAQADGVPVLEYRFLALTVEAETEDESAPSGRVSIAASLPNPDVVPAEKATAIVAAVATAVPGGRLPAPPFRPETGARGAVGSLLPALAAVAAGGLAGALAMGRRSRRRR
jgi:hypothetical protein